MVSHILVPFDGSDAAEAGLKHAVEQFPDATVTVLFVADPLTERGQERSDAPLDPETGEALADGGSLAGPVIRDLDADVRPVVEPGTPAATIVQYAEQNDVDAIVAGQSDRSGVARVLFGSVSETVSRHASMPVTLVE